MRVHDLFLFNNAVSNFHRNAAFVTLFYQGQTIAKFDRDQRLQPLFYDLIGKSVDYLLHSLRSEKMTRTLNVGESIRGAATKVTLPDHLSFGMVSSSTESVSFLNKQIIDYSKFYQYSSTGSRSALHAARQINLVDGKTTKVFG